MENKNINNGYTGNGINRINNDCKNNNNKNNNNDKKKRHQQRKLPQ